MGIVRKVYVISDLHLGGVPAKSPTERGFRMMKHPEALAAFIRGIPGKRTATSAVELVINGDFVDFLAHDHGGKERWKAFAYGKGEALRAFEAIADGVDKPVFDALATLVQTCRLTVMLGNHDLELSLPEVREAFLKRLGAVPFANIRFQYDGEALEVGDAIIEHGNAQDPANAVDFDGLRYLRALRTRGYFDPTLQQRAFEAPPGSKLVATIMNPIKDRYSFIDLLKPESEALYALLLAIEPAAKGELTKLATLLDGVIKNFVPKPGFPAILANVSSGSSASQGDVDPLASVLASALPKDTGAVVAPTARGATLTDVSAGSWVESKVGLFRAFVAGGKDTLPDRLPALRQAFRALEGDPTWSKDVESAKRYRRAAVELSASKGDRRGYAWVVFGHTHHAKRETLNETGAVYLNSGTWANLMKFPALPPDDIGAMATILAFAEDLRDNTFDTEDAGVADAAFTGVGRLRQIFNPTYVRLDVGDDGKVAAGVVETYDWRADHFE